jgi:hypothetical protein
VFGSYRLRDLSVEVRTLRIHVERDNGSFRYVRSLDDSKVEKVLFENAEVYVNPVEPVNLPKKITNFLYISFRRPVLLAPGEAATFYLTFPIEIGVILAKEDVYEDIDIFSFVKPKYALYGEPKGGVIGRYWESDVFTRVPELDPLREGILELRATNLSNRWCEVSKAVFDVYGMKIYYNEHTVSSIAEMKVQSQRVADTSFINKPLFDGMRRAIELYTARALPMFVTKFTMEWGV